MRIGDETEYNDDRDEVIFHSIKKSRTRLLNTIEIQDY